MKKYSFTMECSSYTDNKEQQIDDIESVIDCVKKISNDDMLYIYDEDTQCQFHIEIYNGEYSLSLMNYFRSFKKDEIIKYLSQGFIVFKEIYSDPEKNGFVWEDDGGM